MTEIRFREDFTVECIDHMGDDLRIAQAAWVSTGNEVQEYVHQNNVEYPTELDERARGLLKFLMKNRHGTPFEAGALQMRVEAPIFIWREWHRHRIGFSYNEESARYKQLQPVFYVPGEERRKHCLKPEGFKPSKPGWRGFIERDPISFAEDNEKVRASCQAQYGLYVERLQIGYDNGLARIDLPVGIYSSCYVTCNPRSLMAFLSLRVDEEHAMFETHPLWEMDLIARMVEQLFAQYWPITYEFWNERRVAP